MNLQNGYKVIYDKAAGGKRAFYASKTGFFADADLIMEATIGDYKLIYEKDGKFYGSTTGIPAEGDKCFDELRTVFEAGYVAEAEEQNVEPEVPAGNDDPDAL
jgi:hypothetical protein